MSHGSNLSPMSCGDDDGAGCRAEAFHWRRDEDHETLLPAGGDTRCQLQMRPMGESETTVLRAGAQAAEDNAHDDAPIPFVMQVERRLYLLTWELTRWTLAELEFDAGSCTFVEQRRSSYEWPREAFGVLLSRVALIDRVDPALLQRATEDFGSWLSSQFRVYAHHDS